MPPSFPFGGMENPCLTFVTPCLLAGDRSLADVIIHEISHSWFGNLVTNANWGEFWLNEGFTMYAQRRISTILFGKVPSFQAPGSTLGSICSCGLTVWAGMKGGGTSTENCGVFLYSFSLCECFACMYVCSTYVCLVLAEVGR